MFTPRTFTFVSLSLTLGLAACGDKEGDDTGGTDDTGSTDDTGETAEDLDGDGYYADDCDDSDPEVHPGAPEDYYNQVDNDCDGLIDEDLPHWGYESSEEVVGPEEWATYWPACDDDSQSPIEIVADEIVLPVDPLELNFLYGETPWKVKNNGHTVEFEVEEGSTIELWGTEFTLKQFHFHATSEHSVLFEDEDEGTFFPMEMHLVHQDADGNYAVLGFFIVDSGEDANDYFAKDLDWANIPAAEETKSTEATFDLSYFSDQVYALAAYSGSLTTPPCTQGVQWLISPFDLYLSTAQIKTFTDIYSNNHRPTQDLNGREVEGYELDAPVK